jgi:hypothetical protein
MRENPVASRGDRIDHLGEDDRHGAADVLQRPDDRAAVGQDHAGRERDQLRGVRANALDVARAPAQIDGQVAPVDPAQLRERVLERGDQPLSGRIVLGQVHEHADAPHGAGLLPPRGGRTEQRGRHRTADEDRELASPHETTSMQESGC